MGTPLRFAVLGDPVAHSRSPAIHTEAMNLTGLEGEYVAIRADEARLEMAIEELRTGIFDGLNVTMPLKEAAAAFVGISGSVNTLRSREGRVEGMSTDAAAFRDILSSEGFTDIGNALVLGTGGAARAALAELDGRHTYIAGRSEVRAADVAADNPGVESVMWGTGVAGAMVVNCTPLGMDLEPLPPHVMEAADALIDLPYGPPETPAVAEARGRQLPVVDGFEFLARQATASFYWWTGLPVDFEDLAVAARNV